MINNTATLEQFLHRGAIRLTRSALFDTSPEPLPPTTTFDRVRGMLLGLAIGDALGNTSEGQLPSRRRSLYGEIRDYLPNHHAANRAVGLPSDDTQLAFWTLAQLLEDDGLAPDHLAARFCRDQIYGSGSTTRAFLAAYRSGVPWYEAGPARASNGAFMRIAPILLPHLRQPSPALWADAALDAMTTHNDPASTAACLALVAILWESLRRTTPPDDPRWWLDAFYAVMAPLEGATTYTPRDAPIVWRGSMASFADKFVRDALDRNLPTVDACNAWHSGAFLLETIPSVLYILCRHASDPEEAIVRAVNDTKDNDTVAAIVGAVVGALHGAAALPARWRRGLLGRTTANDDGAVFALIDAAERLWWNVP